MAWVDEDGKPVTDPGITKYLDAQKAKHEAPPSPEGELSGWDEFMYGRPGTAWGDLNRGIAGVAQGALNPLEGGEQLVERGIEAATGHHFETPEWQKRMRDYVESSPYGKAGEFAGDIGSMFVPGMGAVKAAANVPRMAGAASRLLPLIQRYERYAQASPKIASLIRGLVPSALQPVTDNDQLSNREFWDRKGVQEAAGTAAAGTIGLPASQWALSHLGPLAAIHGAAYPFHIGSLHWPLHFLAHAARQQVAPKIRRELRKPSAQRAAGATGGYATDRLERKSDVHIRSLTDPEYRSD